MYFYPLKIRTIIISSIISIIISISIVLGSFKNLSEQFPSLDQTKAKVEVPYLLFAFGL